MGNTKYRLYLRASILIIIIILMALVGTALGAPNTDPCTDSTRGAIEIARDYQRAVRDVRSICTKSDGACDTAEATAGQVLADLDVAHQVIIAECGMTVPPPPPADSPTLFGDLLITEVMANPAVVSDGDAEWIEIFNPTATDFNLEGISFRVTTGGVVDFEINAPLILPAGGFVVIGHTTDTVLNDNVAVDFVADFALVNAGFTLEISNGTTLLDSVIITGTVIVEGVSLGLDPNILDATENDNLGNWCDQLGLYGTFNGGTPGAPNDLCFP